MPMKTKSEIVGELLKEGKINVEEAVILLQGSKEYVYITIPQYPAYPYYSQPFSPLIAGPFTVTCGSTNQTITQ